MGHSPDAHLFYGYTLPDEYEVPESADGTYLDRSVPVRIGHYGYEHEGVYVEITATAAWASDYGTERVDLPGLIAALPDDADDQLRAFATEHGLPLPGQKADGEWSVETASDIGWWLAAAYG
jgi:hypothetical protein